MISLSSRKSRLFQPAPCKRLAGFFLNNYTQRFGLDGLALPAAGCDCAWPIGGGFARSLFGLSLCAGAGGLDLGIHLAVTGYRTVGYVEREACAAATLVARMEDEALDCAPVWDNVADFDGRPWRGVVDIIHGGYPCQPFSVAGRKLGDKDPRHLWPHIARIVREIEPPVCFFENVGGHLRLGFEQVHDDLRSMGYRVKAGLFTAEEVGAPHKRERLFILAYREGFFGERGFSERDLGWQSQVSFGSQRPDMADPTRAGERRKTNQLPETNERQDGSLLRVVDGADCDVADRDSDGCQSQICLSAGEDDPQGRTQRPSNAGACGNGDAADRLSVHQAGCGNGATWREVPDGSRPMADAASAGTGKYKFGSRDQFERGEQDMPDLPLWPPRPADHEAWKDVPADLKPAVRRVADGMADRVDRLRLCGNGVVPLAAAHAFCTLATEAIRQVGE